MVLGDAAYEDDAKFGDAFSLGDCILTARHGDAKLAATPPGSDASGGGRRYVSAASFRLAGLLALGATHPFRKGDADDLKPEALDLAVRLAEAVHHVHVAFGAARG